MSNNNRPSLKEQDKKNIQDVGGVVGQWGHIHWLEKDRICVICKKKIPNGRGG